MADALTCDVCGGSAAVSSRTWLQVKARGGLRFLQGQDRSTFDLCSRRCMESVPLAWLPTLETEPLRRN